MKVPRDLAIPLVLIVVGLLVVALVGAALTHEARRKARKLEKRKLSMIEDTHVQVKALWAAVTELRKQVHSVRDKPLPVVSRAGSPAFGLATWVKKELHGEPTTSGEPHDIYSLTCAHRMLPFGTMVRVTNVENEKTVTVKVNDRGSAKHFPKRIVDLSWLAFRAIAHPDRGKIKVKIEVVE